MHHYFEYANTIGSVVVYYCPDKKRAVADFADGTHDEFKEWMYRVVLNTNNYISGGVRPQDIYHEIGKSEKNEYSTVVKTKVRETPLANDIYVTESGTAYKIMDEGGMMPIPNTDEVKAAIKVLKEAAYV